MSNQENNNIIFSLIEEEENINEQNEFNMDELLDEIHNSDQDILVPQMIHYKENFTNKELLLICEYYGIAKELKANKCNKDIIVQFLVNFESNLENYEVVCKRQNAWFYINELKNDKFMKKYVLW